MKALNPTSFEPAVMRDVSGGAAPLNRSGNILRTRKRKPRRMEPLGSLHGNLNVLAYHVQRAVYASTMTVWADDRGDVYADVPSATIDIPAHWIAGTFGIGLPIEQIEDDLRALLQERSKNWIVD